MQFEQLIGHLCKIIGEPSAELDKDMHIAFSMEDVVLHLQNYSERDTFLAYADIGELPSDGGQPFLEQVLKANWIFQGTDGASLSINRDNGKLSVNQYWKNFNMTPEEFLDVLNRFLQVVQNWREILVNYRQVCSTPHTPEEDVLSKPTDIRLYL